MWLEAVFKPPAPTVRFVEQKLRYEKGIHNILITAFAQELHQIVGVLPFEFTDHM
jgi:hypothetical protein